MTIHHYPWCDVPAHEAAARFDSNLHACLVLLATFDDRGEECEIVLTDAAGDGPRVVVDARGYAAQVQPLAAVEFGAAIKRTPEGEWAQLALTLPAGQAEILLGAAPETIRAIAAELVRLGPVLEEAS